MAEENKTKTESAVEKAVKSDSKPEVKVEKIELQREYVVPLKRDVLKVPRYRRAKKAVRVLREFIAKHMKVENRDISKVSIDRYLNEELWFRGIKKPANRIKVKATKKEGIVYVELAEMPEILKFKKQKEERMMQGVKKTELKHDDKHDHKEENNKEDKKDEAEKEKASQEQGMKENKAQAKAQKHSTAAGHEKKVQPRRTVLQK